MAHPNLPVAAVVAMLVATSCGGDPPASSGAPAASGLQAVVITPVEAPAERLLDGTVEAVEQATISAQTAGRVAALPYDVNDYVPAGAVLVRLRGTEQRAGLAQAEAASREAIAREAEAQSRFARIRDMHERKVVARAQFDQAAAERDAAVARVAAARAAVEAAREGVAYTEITAPYAGVVTARHVRVGEAVVPGTPLVSGLSLQKLRVTVDIPQSLVAPVREQRKAAVYLDGRRIEAAGVTIFPEADAATNTFRTRVELPANAVDLYPGMFVKVGFVTGVATRLLVPGTAVLTRSELTAVYVLPDTGAPVMRQVRLGARFGAEVEVLAGLKPGERVAVDALEALKSLENPGADNG